MYKEPIFLEPVFQERIWVDRNLKQSLSTTYHQVKPGKTLKHAWDSHGELFHRLYEGGEYPLLVKILDTAGDLSVQVHPEDEFAREVEGVRFMRSEKALSF